jgi:hypothetical protein
MIRQPDAAMSEISRALALAHAALDIESPSFVSEARRHGAELLAREARGSRFPSVDELTCLDQLRALIALLDLKLVASLSDTGPLH